MKSKLWLVVLAVVLVAGGFYWWTNGPTEEALTIVVIPAESAVSTTENFDATMEYLEDALEMNVELLTVSDYAAVVEAMRYGHADIARFGPFAYVLATQEADIEAVVVGVKEATGRPEYNALIIAQPGLEDLNGATFAYVDPGSTSGYLAPNTYIKRQGIELGEILFAGSHPAVIEAVKNSSVDAGAVADNRWFYALEEGVVTEEQVKVFWQSNPLPNNPWVVQSDMDPGLKEAFANAMLEMPEEIVLKQGVKEIGYLPVTDSDYDFIREIAENAEE